MTRLIAAAALLGFAGSTLVLSELRWFNSKSLVSRIAPYLPGTSAPLSSELLSVEGFRELLRPLALSLGAVAARVFGVDEELPRRLC